MAPLGVDRIKTVPKLRALNADCGETRKHYVIDCFPEIRGDHIHPATAVSCPYLRACMLLVCTLEYLKASRASGTGCVGRWCLLLIDIVATIEVGTDLACLAPLTNNLLAPEKVLVRALVRRRRWCGNMLPATV